MLRHRLGHRPPTPNIGRDSLIRLDLRRDHVDDFFRQGLWYADHAVEIADDDVARVDGRVLVLAL